MFAETFSFHAPTSPSPGAAADAISAREVPRCASPCSSTATYSSLDLSVTDLSAILANSRLRPESQICYDPCAAYAATDDDAGWQLDPFPTQDLRHDASAICSTRSRHPRAHSPTRRACRQSHTRLLCSGAHHKEIASLVSRMVACKEQCSILALDLTPDPNAHDETGTEDEGYDSSSDTTNSEQERIDTLRRSLRYRRSFDVKSSACVSKAVRFRKERRHRTTRSSESV